MSAAAAAIGCRRRPYDASAFVVPATSPVMLFSAAAYSADLVDIIARGLKTLQVPVRQRSVLLKPNLVEYEQGSVINTHPALIVSAADALLKAGAARVVVAEGPGHRRDIEYLLVSTGLVEHLRDHRLEFVDLNHDDVRSVKSASAFTGLKEWALPETLLQADLIVSLPKLKTHHWAGMTCSMKNLFGVVPGAIYGWPKNLLHRIGIDNSIVDLTATVRPHLAIVDGIVAMEGDGPIMGTPRALGLVAMSTDVVALDATCARIMGLEPTRLEYLAAASDFLGNLKTSHIEHRGEPPSRFATSFAIGKHLGHLRA
jgi:uncharacterized protein (DUF362 family)